MKDGRGWPSESSGNSNAGRGEVGIRKAARPASASAESEPRDLAGLGKLTESKAKTEPPHLQAPPRRKGGRRSRDKGNRAERSLVRFLIAHGFAAEPVPFSGSAGDRFASDVVLQLLGLDRVVEVKCRANGFREIYRWLDGRDMLVVRADRQELLSCRSSSPPK